MNVRAELGLEGWYDFVREMVRVVEQIGQGFRVELVP